MGGQGGKPSLKQKSRKAKGKSQEMKAPLAVTSKDKPVTPIDEIRRQGLVLAWQGIGEATRQRTGGAAAPVRPAVSRPPVAVKSAVKRPAVAR
jgi:hypothetical protein